MGINGLISILDDSEPHQLLHSERGHWISGPDELSSAMLYDDVPVVSTSCSGEKLLRFFGICFVGYLCSVTNRDQRIYLTVTER